MCSTTPGSSTSLKCLSARFVIDIHGSGWKARHDHRGLKCLSARFVIDINISTLDEVEVEAPSLKCLSARFVIDIFDGGDRNGSRACAVSNAFRLDS